jgi:ribose 5-phosphate isomerase A
MDEKEIAAAAAVKMVQRGFVIGLGTGSTAAHFIKLLGERAKNERLLLRCVPTSVASELLAKQVGLPVARLEDIGRIDIAVDGADRIDSQLNLIKGYGGALLREKVVDYAAKQFIVIADASKLCDSLDAKVPVEVVPFAVAQVKRDLQRLKAKAMEVRAAHAGGHFMTDNGNLIIDMSFGTIKNPAELERKINEIPGVVESGIFTKNVDCVIIGTKKGAKVIKKKD